MLPGSSLRKQLTKSGYLLRGVPNFHHRANVPLLQTFSRSITELKRQDSEQMLARRGSVLVEVNAQKDNLAEMLNVSHNSAVSEMVPWFLRQMPDSYFQQVPEELREQHLRALAGIRDSAMIPELSLKSPNGALTLIRPTNEPGQLLDMLKSLQQLADEGKIKGELASLQVYVAKDNSLSLNVFQFAERVPGGYEVVPPQLLQYVKDVQAGKYQGQDGHVPPDAKLLQKENILTFMKRCRPQYIANTSARRFCLHMAMCDEISKGGDYAEGLVTEVENDWADVRGDALITLALTHVEPLAALSRVSQFLSSLKIDISRVHLDVIPGQPDITMLRVLTTPFKDPETNRVSSWGDLSVEGAGYDLGRAAKWVDDRVLETFSRRQAIASKLAQPQSAIENGEKRLFSTSSSLIHAEVTVALSDCIHALLSPADPYQFARSRVLWSLTESAPVRDCANEMIDHFCSKFSKRFRSEFGFFPYDSAAMRTKINAKVELPMMRAILEKLQDIVEGVIRTNLDQESRYALSFRWDPKKCTPVKPQFDVVDRETPYGVFFVTGRRFTGFHIRFRDIARGGLRLVTPYSSELRSMETSRHYFECFDLAFAQQLKNKDIAEGGAKAVVICDSVGLSDRGKQRAMRRSVRAFVDSILDILAPNADELLYFGPDEQIVPNDIDWISKRAVERGYPLGSVVISSKAHEGINHKEYGVTSEGVNVFLQHALQEVGIDPKKQRFTIKLTGGPDGDVAGNMLRILHRDYGENCRVVGISDGTGAAEDPEGLNWGELLRLVKISQPLSQMNPSAALTSRYGKFGVVSEQEGLLMRNTMHMRVKSDAFVPAGGRPAAINANNWKSYLDPTTAEPSSKLIVEGANLFLTAKARELLSVESKCLIVKDSSANKCGVVTSSYEVLAGMILNRDQFLSVKPDYVSQVLNRLRYIASSEAGLLMREWRSGRVQVLPEACIGLSHAIIKVADAVETQPVDDDLIRFVASLLPLNPLLNALNVAKPDMDDKIRLLKTKLPPAYLKGLVSKVVASECVYREGTEYFDGNKQSMNPQLIGAKAIQYVKAVGKIEGFLHNLKDSNPQVAQILRVAGPRAYLEFEKELK